MLASVHRSSTSSGDNTLTATTAKSFSFKAYSLSSALLMGSSIGLVILQNHQLWFLNGLLTLPSTLTTTTGSTAGQSKPTAASEATTSAVGTMATAFMAELWHFMSFMVSARIPLLVWFLSLLTSALWTHRYFNRSRPSRGHPPPKRTSTSSSSPKSIHTRQQEKKGQRVFTPRTAILASHVLFSFFWVVLAAVQEVEEQRTRSNGRGGGRTKIETGSQGHNDPGHHSHVAQIPTTSSLSTTTTPGALMMLSPEERQALTLANASDGSMVVYPLCFIWLSAVVLLGLATGLMTSSSAVLEDRASCMKNNDNDNDFWTGPEGVILNTAKTQQHNEKEEEPEAKQDGQEPSCTLSNSANTTTPLVGLAHFSWAQRACLFLLLQLLFSILMPFYQWMLSLDRILPPSLSPTSSSATAWLSTSSAMTLSGVFLGTLMVGLGRRFIPADPTMTPFSHTHRHL